MRENVQIRVAVVLVVFVLLIVGWLSFVVMSQPPRQSVWERVLRTDPMTGIVSEDSEQRIASMYVLRAQANRLSQDELQFLFRRACEADLGELQSIALGEVIGRASDGDWVRDQVNGIRESLASGERVCANPWIEATLSSTLQVLERRGK